jgi:predicted TIM-barrel fold metal-dependent hydrolase
MKIIDIHTHVGDCLYGLPLDEPYERPVRTPGDLAEWTGYRLNMAPRGFRTLVRYLEVIHTHHRNNCATVENLRRFSQPYGVTHSVLLPVEPVISTEFTMEVAAANSKPDHCLLSFASVDPKNPHKLEKLEKYMAAGCLGLKLHPIMQNTPATDEQYFEIAEAMKKYKKPILIHAGKTPYYLPYYKRMEYGDARTYERLIAAFPEVPFILAHMNIREPEAVWELARKYENVFADASFQSARNIRRAFDQMGTDRVMYGSDCPFGLPKYPLKVGKRATRGNRDLAEKFFFRNAESLLGELAPPE